MSSKIIDEIFRNHRIDLKKPKFDIAIVIEMMYDAMKAAESPQSLLVEEAAKEYATGMMGLGEYNEKTWHYGDKTLFNTIVRAVKYGASIQSLIPKSLPEDIKEFIKNEAEAYINHGMGVHDYQPLQVAFREGATLLHSTYISPLQEENKKLREALQTLRHGIFKDEASVNEFIDNALKQ